MAKRCTLLITGFVLVLAVAMLLRRWKSHDSRISTSTSHQAKVHFSNGESTVKSVALEKAPMLVPPRNNEFRIEVSFQSNLWRLLENHRKVCNGVNGRICHGSELFFPGSQASGRDQLRLLALAFPRESLAVAQKILETSPRPQADSEAALWMLAVLSDSGNELAKGVILATGLSADSLTSSVAVEMVVRTSAFEYFRPAFLKKAAEGNLSAIASLSRIVDDESRKVLRDLSADKTYVGTLARETLELQSASEGPEWPSTFEGIIEGDGGKWSRLVWWALEVAARRPVPGMMNSLRQRLDHAKQTFQFRFREENDHRYPDKAVLEAEYERSFKTSFSIDRVDLFYSHVLLAYSSLGGELTSLERGHLNLMGYGCDPKKRLAETLADNSEAEACDRDLKKRLAESPQQLPDWFGQYIR